MTDQGGGSVTRMEGTTKNVDEELENVSLSYSSGYCHGSFVEGALGEYVPRQNSGEDGNKKSVVESRNVDEVCGNSKP